MLRCFARVVIVVQRDLLLITLDEATAWRVVASGRQRQAGIFTQTGDCLNQSLPKAGFADHQTPIMVLNRSGNDFRRRSGKAIDQDDDRYSNALIPVDCPVSALGSAPAVMRHDKLIFLQEHVRDADGGGQESAVTS